MSRSRPTIFISAGEASGDNHGANLARELKARLPGVRLVGLGGSRMREVGVELLAGLDRLAIIGFGEVVRRLPDLARMRRSVHAALSSMDVDLVVPINYPGFNLRLAGRAHATGIPVLYYIPPQVWAWKEKRARKLAEWSDEVCVAFSFECDLLASYGARVHFVGHPLLDEPYAVADPGAFGVGLFPGSREQEVAEMLPVFLEAAERLTESHQGLGVLVARAHDLPDRAYDACPPEMLAEPEEVIRRSRAAITKSGTITLQLALARLPMVVGYRVHPVSYRILKRLVRVEHVALANLVTGRPVVKEFLQSEMTAGNLAGETGRLLENPGYRQRVLAGLKEAADRLGPPGAAGRVADRCVALLDSRRQAT